MVLKNKTQGRYLVISQSIMHDQSLKLFDRGLLVTLMSLPDNWNFTINGLAAILCDGRDAISGGLKRLQDSGYLVKEQLRENGKFGDICLRINLEPDGSAGGRQEDATVLRDKSAVDTPITEKPSTEKPLPEKPSTGIPITGNPSTEKPSPVIPTQLNNNKSNIQKSMIHKSNIQEFVRVDGKGAKHGTGNGSDNGAGDRADTKGLDKAGRGEKPRWSKDEIDLYGL